MAVPSLKSRAGRLASNLLQDLNVALAGGHASGPERNLSQEALDRAWRHLDELDRLLGGRGFKILVDGDCFTFGGEPLVEASMKASRLLSALLGQLVGGIDFNGGARIGDLELLVDQLRYPAQQDLDPEWANTTLAGHGCQGLSLLPRQGAGAGGDGGEGSRGKTHLRIYQELVSTLQEQIVRVLQGGNLRLAPLRGKVLLAAEKIDNDPAGLLALARCKQYDPMGLGHAAGVCLLILNYLGRFVRSREDRISMGLAGLVHNIGNVRLPFAIFLNPGRLDREQWEQVSRHPEYGVEILMDADEHDPLVLAAIFGHHRERRGGYPDTLVDQPISAAARIVRICDIYTALTSPRVYKSPLDPLQAYRVMLSMKDRLDQAMLKHFISLNGLYPLGSQVTLSNDHEGLVVEQTKRPDCPLVKDLTILGHPLVQTGRSERDVRVTAFSVREVDLT